MFTESYINFWRVVFQFFLRLRDRHNERLKQCFAQHGWRILMI